jgi:DNA-binding NtrC family response regulator
MAKVLIVDDEAAICWAFRALVEDSGHKAIVASSLARGREAFQQEAPDFVFLDVRLPDGNGLSLLEEMRAHSKDLAVVVMTAHGGFETAVQAMQKGAFDYLVKPIDLTKARTMMARALADRSRSKLPVVNASGVALVGRSAIIQEIFKSIAIVGSATAPVLIQGESGTGKELVARAIHEASARRDKPFVPIDCAALPLELVESELYGHKQGAFTGAVTEHAGRIRQANGGTLFLDEIGELPLRAQPKFLRFLAEREIIPIGRTRAIPVDVRIVAATNQCLSEAVSQGRFRDDLYYRLNVSVIQLPPLRQRKEDLPLLVQHFLASAPQPRQISDDALQCLIDYDWPGNIRELRNALQHAAMQARSQYIFSDHLPADITTSSLLGSKLGLNLDKELELLIPRLLDKALAAAQAPHSDILRQVDKLLIKEALRRCNDSRSAAARLLKVTRATLRKRLQSDS